MTRTRYAKMYQKTVRWGEESMAEMELVSSGKKQATHVNREKVGAMAASNRHRLEEASARHTHLQLHKQNYTLIPGKLFLTKSSCE